MSCRTGVEEQRRDTLETLFSGLASAGEPGGAVLAVKDGRAVFERGFGVADLRAQRPIGRRTNFRLASVSKQFTAAAVMLLVRERRLGYDTGLKDVFPDFPEYGRAVTIRHLLNHTSGLPDYEDLLPPRDPAVPVEEAQVRDADVLELLKTQTAGKFAPGSRWAYSNSGYVLLGLIAEKVSGRSFPRLLEERIFAPLGMRGTVAYVRGLNEVPERAYGHSRQNGRWRESDQSRTSATLGDGGVYSSPADLAEWDEALRRNVLFSREEFREALLPVSVPGQGPEEPDGTPASYGFGWFLNSWRGRARMWHYGETTGFRTAIHRFPEDGLTVIVLCNRSDLEASALALKAAERILF
jgi:CubicO group peptidase (beta-lactamase class C family)